MKIAYMDLTQINDPRIKDITQQYQYDWNNIENLAGYNPVCNSYTVRKGKNILPFDNSIVDQLKLNMPEFEDTFNYSLNDVTDGRCIELFLQYQHKPWLVYWSGGIDSTTMVASILKNLAPADRKHIKIACNRISIYENPRFFYDHIRPNFELVDSTRLVLNTEILEKYYHVTGEFSDQMFSGMIGIQLQQKNIESLGYDLFHNPDQLIDYLKIKFKKKSSAEWFYEQMVSNIKSTALPICTYSDFLWWWFFNLMWTTVKIRPMLCFSYSPELVNLYLKNHIAWFESVDYQRWSMKYNLVDHHEQRHLSNYKDSLKNYIHDYDKNDYYRFFKSKVNSGSRMINNSVEMFCILDDFTKLTLSQDLEQIRALLPDYININ